VLIPLAAVLLLSADRPAHADWPPLPGADLTLPENWPDDPGYDGQWNLWSFMHEANLGQVSDYEASVGSGIHADRAWQQTIGEPAVVIAVLDSGKLAHAYLDVFEHEPLPHDHPLWTHPAITITPHSAALTEPRTAVPRIVENIERLRRGEPPHNLVDFDAGY